DVTNLRRLPSASRYPPKKCARRRSTRDAGARAEWPLPPRDTDLPAGIRSRAHEQNRGTPTTVATTDRSRERSGWRGTSHPDWSGAVGTMDRRFDAHQPHAATRGRGDRRPELRREAREFRHHRASQPLARPEPEDLLGGRIRVQQPAVRIHGEYAGAQVAQDVVRLELHLAHFGGERFPLRAHDVHPTRDIGGDDGDE